MNTVLSVQGASAPVKMRQALQLEERELVSSAPGSSESGDMQFHLAQKLSDALPGHVAISNPLDLRDDASSEHYVKTLDILLHLTS